MKVEKTVKTKVKRPRNDNTRSFEAKQRAIVLKKLRAEKYSVN